MKRFRLSTIVVLLTSSAAATGCSKSQPDAAPLAAQPQPSAQPSAAPSAREAVPAPAAPRPAAMAQPTTPTDLKAPPKTATKTSSGLAYVVVEAGTGQSSPSGSDQVVAHYAAWTTNGTMFDRSFSRGEPSTFAVSGVINGWSEGLKLMHVGDRYRLWIPAKLAYGDDPKPGIPRGMVIFDVQLLEINPPPAPDASATP